MSALPGEQRPSLRPPGIWLLAMVFGLFGLIGLIRAVLAWQNGEYYLSLGMKIAPALLVLYGIVWAISGFGGMIVLFFRRFWVRIIVWCCAGVLTITYWGDRLFLTINPGRQVNTGFAMFANLLLLVWTAWILHRKKFEAYFEGGERIKKRHAE